MAYSQGRAIASRIAPGQAHDLPEAIPLLERHRVCPSRLWRLAAIQVAASANTSGAWQPDTGKFSLWPVQFPGIRSQAHASAIEDLDETDKERINRDILNMHSGEKSRAN